MTITPFWTEERDALAIKLSNEGVSRSEIAKRIGAGCTRNSVGGRLHRLGHAVPLERISETRVLAAKMGAAATNRAKTSREPKPEPKAGKSKPTAVPTGDRDTAHSAVDRATIKGLALVERREGVAPAKAVPLWKLQPHACKWPVGQRKDGFGAYHVFCGRAADDTYCPAHGKDSLPRDQRSNQAQEKAA